MRRSLVLAVLCVSLIGGACGDDDDDGSTAGTPAPTGSGAPTGSADDPTSCAPQLGTDAMSGAPEGDVALQTDLTIDQSGCTAAVTFSFRDAADPALGPVVPGFTAESVEPPFVADGSGEPVSVDGDSFVLVRFEPASIVDLSVDPFETTYDGPPSLVPDGEGPVLEVARLGSFEAVTTYVIGLRGEPGFTVDVLADPPRLVLSIG